MAKARDKETNKYIIRELSKKALPRWILDCSFDWTVICSAYILAGAWNNPLGYFLAMFVIGNRQHAFAILGHDGTHYTIHKNKKLNDFISDFFAFWWIGLTTSGYRNLHFRHHSHLNTEHDPELGHRGSRAPQWDLPITAPKILKYAFMDLFGYSISDYISFLQFAIPDSKLSYVPLIILHFSFTFIFLWLGLFWVPVLWYISLLTWFMMFFRLRTWLEHQGSDDTHRLKLNWFESIILSPHNAWYHYEHHSYPTVPNHRLHLLREKLPEEPVMTLRQLLKKYKNISEIRSGAPLKKSVSI